MAHRTLKSSYSSLVDRLNKFPQGAPPSELLTAILKILFREKEAALVALLPIRPFDAETAAHAWRMDVREAAKILDDLARRALLVDVEQEGRSVYTLPPPMAGFFEFSLMRIRDDIDQKALSELFYKYLNVEEDFIKALFTEGVTQLGRVFVQEPMLPPDSSLEVLDFERASKVVETATHIGVGTCYCRHKMMHMGRACDAPMDICMTFNASAETLVKHGHAREKSVAECMGLLETAYERGLVQFGENVQRGVNFICNCCGCCCEALIAQRKFGILHPIHTTSFLPSVDEASCSGCGLCVMACPVQAMSLVSSGDPSNKRRLKAALSEESCLGCGVCARACKKGSISLHSRPSRVITPVDTVHRAVVMAIERGKLQNLIFDNQALASHRAMAAVLGAILRLPPAKQILASEQVRSKYLVALLERIKI